MKQVNKFQKAYGGVRVEEKLPEVHGGTQYGGERTGRGVVLGRLCRLLDTTNVTEEELQKLRSVMDRTWVMLGFQLVVFRDAGAGKQAFAIRALELKVPDAMVRSLEQEPAHRYPASDRWHTLLSVDTQRDDPLD